MGMQTLAQPETEHRTSLGKFPVVLSYQSSETCNFFRVYAFSYEVKEALERAVSQGRIISLELKSANVEAYQVLDCAVRLSIKAPAEISVFNKDARKRQEAVNFLEEILA